MAGERGAVRHDHAVADDAIVRDVRLGHDQTIIARLRQHAAARRAAMNGNELADAVSFADARLGRLAFVFQILRCESDRDKRKDMRALANSGAPVNDAMRFETHTVAQLHFVANYRVRADITVAAEARLRADDCGRMNATGRFCVGDG